MMNFLLYYLQILLLTVAAFFLFGLTISLCNRIFCALVGNRSGQPLVLFTHVFSTPLREFGHLAAAIIFMHRVTDFCLLNIHDPEGELGFVEHSYNPKNPIAVLGNFFFAIFPSAVGLFAVMCVVLTCFRGVFPAFAAQVSELDAAGAGLGSYCSLAADFLPSMFRDAQTGVFLKIIGCLLLLPICLGICVSFDDMRDALSGFFAYAVLTFLFAGITALFDDRLRRLILHGLHAFATGVTALYLVALVFSVAMLAIAAIFFVIRTLFNLDRGPRYPVEKNRYDT